MIFPPKKDYLVISMADQLDKIIEEVTEAKAELQLVIDNPNHDSHELYVELYDVLHACETLRRKMEFEISGYQQLLAIESVKGKNDKRGYYE